MRDASLHADPRGSDCGRALLALIPTAFMTNVLIFRRRHLIEIERVSRCRTWTERFLVEVRAATVEDALRQVRFSLGNSETIVPGNHCGYPEAA